MPSETRSPRAWSRAVNSLPPFPLDLAFALVLVVALGACASQPPLALAATRDSLASLDEFGALLLGAGLPVNAIPQGRELTPEDAGKALRYFAILPPLPQQYAPRRVAEELLRYVEDKGVSVSRWDLSLRVQDYKNLFVLTPQGYLAAALTGAPAYCVGALQVSSTGVGAGGFEMGRYYTNSGGASWPQVEAPHLDRN